MLVDQREEGLSREQAVAARLMHGADPLDLEAVCQRAESAVHPLHCRHHVLRRDEEREKTRTREET